MSEEKKESNYRYLREVVGDNDQDQKEEKRLDETERE